MTLLLNPLLDALKVARNAAPGVTNADDEVTVEDLGDSWVFEFIPQADQLGGGATISIAKGDLRVLKVVLGQ